MKVPIVLIILLPFAACFLPLGCKTEPAPAAAPAPALLLCNTTSCLVGQNSCAKAACMPPFGGGATVCEFAAKLTGTCRCLPGDKRSCGGSLYKTCIQGAANDTYWGTCS